MMIYKLYYIDKDNSKLVRDIDDIHENNVWAVCDIWGIGIAVALESDPQPTDSADYAPAEI
jgi:hypothetical protein